ncbi:MAG: hypothetical protein ACKOW8_01305, partial [Flavobacteriales bacterium]
KKVAPKPTPKKAVVKKAVTQKTTKVKVSATKKPVVKKAVKKAVVAKPIAKNSSKKTAAKPLVAKGKVAKKAAPKSTPKAALKQSKAVKGTTAKKTKSVTKPVVATKAKTKVVETKNKKTESNKPVKATVAKAAKGTVVPPVKGAVAKQAPAKTGAKPTKTVEQQLQEKQSKTVAAPDKKGKKTVEPSPEDGIVFPGLGNIAPMRRRTPVFIEEVSNKPVANPVFVPTGGDVRNVVKFAPVAIIERPKEKNNKTEEEDMSSKTSPRLAFQESDDKKGISVEAKLRALYAIQLFDSRIDKIHAMRGELPLEVQDLEDDVAGLEARVERMTEDHKVIADDITNRKMGIKNAEALIKKYKEQLNNVKNNREFDSLNKEIEFQELEIQLHTKKIKESEGLAGIKAETLEANKIKLEERKNDLKVKRKELDDIIASTEKEEKLLRKKSDEAKKKIEERLLAAYERIRSGSPNGMAVVPIEREASAGSFIQLPPQKQLDVAARRRVIVDEHSGRILVDGDLAREEQAAFDKMVSSDLV